MNINKSLTPEQFKKVKDRAENLGRRKFKKEDQELFIEAFLIGAEFMCDVLDVDPVPKKDVKSGAV